MNLTFDINALPDEEQKKLYLWLKAKFDPDSSNILFNETSDKEVLLNQDLEFLNLSARSISALAAKGLQNVRELCNCKISDLMNLKGFGNGCLKEVEFTLAEYELSLKPE